MGFECFCHTVSSVPVTVAPERGMRCYWQVPCRKHARITLTNESENKVNIVAYRVLYKLIPLSEDSTYLHAQYRHKLTSKDDPELVIPVAYWYWMEPHQPFPELPGMKERGDL